jgi:hypothetical protein
MKMKVEVFVPQDAMRWVARASNMTQGFPLDRPVNMKVWRLMLAGEHSPIREMKVHLVIGSVPYWAANHLRTHLVAMDVYDAVQMPPLHTRDWQCFVRSQRPDSYNPVEYDRDTAPQGAPVNMVISTNPNGLIVVSRKRLCRQAHSVTREIWEEVHQAIKGSDDQYVAAVGDYMMPDCEYRGECPYGRNCYE